MLNNKQKQEVQQECKRRTASDEELAAKFSKICNFLPQSALSMAERDAALASRIG